jgi:poly(3-hydroxybutyrate) depolymerase
MPRHARLPARRLTDSSGTVDVEAYTIAGAGHDLPQAFTLNGGACAVPPRLSGDGTPAPAAPGSSR